MNDASQRRVPWHRLGLRSRLAVAIAGVGLLALGLNAILLAIFLNGYLVDRQGKLVEDQARTLGQCCHSTVSSVLSRPTVLARAMDLAMAGSPQRLAVIVDARGGLRYASPSISDALVQTLTARLRRDLASMAASTSYAPHWTQLDGQIVSDVPLYAGGSTSNDGSRRIAGALLLADSQGVKGLIALVLGTGAAAVALAVVGGMLAATAITRPVRAVTAAARAIAKGDLQRRVAPAGPAEMHEMALAFNTMVEEVVHQRRIERDLLANVSHELAAPLGLIRGYAEALSDDMIVGEENRLNAVRAIGAETKRLSRLSGDLLDLALLETGQVSVFPESVPVADLLAGLSERFRPVALRAGIALNAEAPRELPPLHTDGLRLEQVLVNLINNALRHTPCGGTVTLRGIDAGADLRLEIADTGTGIPDEDLARIWERFYQVDKGRDRRDGEAGVGLGLAICRSTVTLLGGRITAESAIGRGTTFTIYLPLRRS